MPSIVTVLARSPSASRRGHLSRLLALVLTTGLLVGQSTPSHAADDYPNKTVRVIVPYSTGGPTDIVARVLAEKLSKLDNVSYIVDNKPGGGANIGAELAAHAPADGYTILIGTATHAINATLFEGLKYDLVKDFKAVTLLTSGPLVLVTNPQTPANNLKELIALAKAKPDTMTFASSGNGASTHLAGEMFNAQAGIRTAHLPYRGSGPALTDVMGGQATYMFDTTLSAMPFVASGKLKALAVTSLKRAPALPNVPTMAEQGLPGFEAIAWNGVFVPSKTPAPIVAKLNASIRQVLEMPDVKEKFATQGFTADWQSPDKFEGFVKAEVSKWGTIVKSAHVKVE